jgi:hypothetical protein
LARGECKVSRYAKLRTEALYRPVPDGGNVHIRDIPEFFSSAPVLTISWLEMIVLLIRLIADSFRKHTQLQAEITIRAELRSPLKESEHTMYSTSNDVS